MDYKRFGIAPRGRLGARALASAAVSAWLMRLWEKDPSEAERAALRFYKGDAIKANMRMFWMVRSRSDSEAERYAIAAVENGGRDVEAVKRYTQHMYRTGHLKRLEQFAPHMRRTKRTARLMDTIEANIGLLDNGFEALDFDPDYAYPPIAYRTFYLLHNSLPHNSGGYATRSHGLLRGLSRAGFEAIGVTRNGYPHDRWKKNRDRILPDNDVIDEVKYLRLFDDIFGLGMTSMDDYLARNVARTGALARQLRPSIIHGASNFMNGTTAAAVARRHGAMSIYEVRGLWEVTRMSRETTYKGTDAYNLYVRMETQACHDVDQVFAITGALKNELISRGVPSEKVLVIPNGVDTSRFTPLKPDHDLRTSLNISPHDVVIGYVGSVVDYEGLDYLIEAMHTFKRRGDTHVKLVIVGDGAFLGRVQELVTEREVGDTVTLVGRVPHEEVESYYSIIDIAPFPRKGLPVCEMVSPLKPFEAMAMGKAVLVSNVAAMEEFVEDGVTGLVFEKDSPEALYKALRNLAASPELRRRLGRSARSFVVRERDWKVISANVADVYHDLIITRQRLGSTHRFLPGIQS